MDERSFDDLTRALATGTSRRRALKVLGGSLLGAVGLSGARLAGAAGGNSACAAFCAQVFGNTKAAGKCTSDAAHGQGLCYQCGPKGDGRHKLCGQACIAATDCCGGCSAPQTCGGGGTPGQCGCTPATTCPAGQTCGAAPDGCGGTLQCGSCSGGTACSPVSCQNGQCVHTPIAGCCASDADCDDGRACTTDTCDTSTNTCQHSAVTCQPMDACHTATCDPQQGCLQTPVANGTACGTSMTCQAGVCTCVDGGTACQGLQCGTVINNCGQQVFCGTCNSGATCTNGTCVASDPCAEVSCGACQTCSGGSCVADGTQDGFTCTASGGQSGTCLSGTCQGPGSCDCRNLNFCSGHGTCQPDCTCLCDSGYTGVSCTPPPPPTCPDFTDCTSCQASPLNCVWCSLSVTNATSVCTTLANCINLQPSCSA